VNRHAADDDFRADDAHSLRIRSDPCGVIAWCRCNRWGYFGSDEDRADELHRLHVAQAEADEAEDDEP
jgi:hypothetical protein